MVSITRLYKRARAALLTRLRRYVYRQHAGERVDPPAPLYDGIDYSQPPIVPHTWLRERPQVVKRIFEADAADVFRNQFGLPYLGTDAAPIAPTYEDPLMEWDIATRTRVLRSCHASFNRNPIANALVNYTVDFVVGDGLTITYRNQEVKALLQAVIDNPENAFRDMEKALLKDLQVDGEVFLRLFGRGEDTLIIPQRPWEIQYIKTEKGNFRRPLVYHAQRLVSEGDSPTGQTVEIEDIPAAEIIHAAINRHATELRGRPDLYPLLPWLRADVQWLGDRMTQSKWRGGLMWHVKVAGGGNALASALSRWRKPPNPGSVEVSSDKQEVIPLVNPANAGDNAADGRAVRLMVIAGMRLPEYFVADGQNANLATASKQELPALTKFESYQAVLINQLWKPLARRIINQAVDDGLLADFVQVQDGDGNPILDDGKPVDLIRACDAFDFAYDPVTAEDFAALVNALAVAEDRRWIDRITAQEKLGFDHESIAKRLQVQDAEEDAGDMDALNRAARYGEPPPVDDDLSLDDGLNAAPPPSKGEVPSGGLRPPLHKPQFPRDSLTAQGR